MARSSTAAKRITWLTHDERTVSGFLRRYVPFNLILTTAIALLITAAERSVADLGVNLAFSYCIGFSILGLNMVLRVLVLPRENSSFPVLLGCFALTIPAGLLIGAKIAVLLTGGRQIGFESSLDWTFAGVFSLIGGGFAMLYLVGVERQRRAEQAQKAAVNAQLRTLQAQIEPHFLFNTLASLDALITTDAAQARTMLAHLNRYLRSSLSHVRSGSATLQAELDLMRSYLAIMQMRLPTRLQAYVHCDPDLLDLPFPPMLIQPLVENAVIHGVEPLTEGGQIALTARRVNGRLVIVVTDTGAGVSPDVLERPGVGLSNVVQRLSALFDRAATLSIGPAAPRGTRVEVCIPVHMLDVDYSLATNESRAWNVDI